MTSRLWFDQPATRWFEALPIGNGRIGGMVYSGIDLERIQLAETTAWSGAPSERDVDTTAREQFPLIRETLFRGDFAEAQRLSDEHLLGRKNSFGTNLPLPELCLTLPSSQGSIDYERSLDLSDGVVRSQSRVGTTTHRREIFASHPDKVIVIRLTADDLAAISFELNFGPAVFATTTYTEDGTLVLRGRATETLHSNGVDGVDIEAHAKVMAEGGRTSLNTDALRVDSADAVTVIVAIGTSWDGRDPRRDARQAIRHAETIPYSELLRRHTEDFSALESRVVFDLGSSDENIVVMPTDRRRDLYAAGGMDPELETLFFRFGRYLTIAGSREDSPLPLALQGLWNDGLASSASWTNDFHIDMNTQQNYWAAEVTNLPECHEPLSRLVENLSHTGRSTAAGMYGLPGWVAHTVTNAWGYSAPGTGPGWGLHVTAGAWIALHLWDHYDYSRNSDYLRERAYPVLRGAAEFFLAYLTPDPQTGWLVTGPSDSPENWFLTPTGERCAVSMGNTCDRVFVDAMFRVCIEATEALDVDHDFAAQLVTARRLLPPFQVGKHGQLQEWLQDFDEAIPSHRHTSHLCSVYPEWQIRPRTTPELAAAAEVTIALRESAPGWEQTEWVEANMITYFARLLKGDKAHLHLRQLIGETAEANLMTFSAGGVAGAAQNIYSFDGNPGATAGIAEMLMQSDGDEIELLPALPQAWLAGEMSGLRARGGFTVNVKWSEGGLSGATIVADRNSTIRVRSGDRVEAVSLIAGRELNAWELIKRV